ncbi:MAG: sigma-54-dependent Fis family transcriptional regulator [Lentisphaerae bacterium]|nr:sigma-54-dependent Fis family transcriptional regulator [Lentisphaerota bacterium]
MVGICVAYLRRAGVAGTAGVTKMLLRVLVAIDDAPLQARLSALLKEEDALICDPLPGSDWDAVVSYPCDVLITLRRMIPEPRGATVAKLADNADAPGIVVLTLNESPAEEAELVACGADVVLFAGVSDDILVRALDNAIGARRALLSRSLAAKRAMARPQLSDFVSASPAMQRFMKTVHRVVDSDAPMLITGETGVGKERLARAIHAASQRSDGGFISLNCGAIPENLLESELFGHEKGAFTGATRTQRGCFELAHDGTLFLDEISEMPFHLQVKLLHVLQDFEVHPVGSERRIPVDVRVIAATNRDIQDEVKEKRFRQDLYYRLSVVTLELPPLRERREDIPALAASFVTDLSARVGRKVDGISQAALRRLVEYGWPGNVRELVNVLERAILLCEGRMIEPEDMPEEVNAAVPQEVSVEGVGGWDTAKWVDRPLREGREVFSQRFEKEYLAMLLQRTQGKVAETARMAGIEPRSLFSKMRKYGLRKQDFKPSKEQ